MKQKKDLLENGVEDDIKFTINKEYAAKYTTWRQKERLQTLKDRYGDISDVESSSTSEEEDENARELTKDVEKNFFRALSCLKQKDPRIYDANVKFFDEDRASEPVAAAKSKEEKPFLLKDHQRRIILEKSGKFVDDEGGEVGDEDLTPAQEQNAIKESFKDFLADSDDEGRGSWGGLFQKKEKTKEELKKEGEDYIEWLKGQKEELPNKALESDMKYLHDYWNDPNLNNDEAFLKDYILNRRFLESDDEDYVPRFPDINVEDEDKLVEQEEFEYKYNFRFEKEDPEFIKSYPRTVEHSMRKKDDRRKRKRQEIRERKEREKLEKAEEIKQLKALKRKELLEKIEKIKAVTGNAELPFQDEDLEGDFDPEAHDRKMKELFNDDYYEEGEEEKPTFPEWDEDMEIENWNEWTGPKDKNFSQNSGHYKEEAYNENAEFNMDCDYDPRADVQNELIQMTKSKKKRRRQSKLAQALARAKPAFDPNDKTFDEYLDEYYKLDYEDIVGGMPTRFKYRQTVPNSYGLTVDEILRADEKELNQWCSLKKVVKMKPEQVERYDVQAYARKGANEALKRKILPSLYANSVEEDSEETQDGSSSWSTRNSNEGEGQSGKKRKNRYEKETGNDHMEMPPSKKLKSKKPCPENGVESNKEQSEEFNGEEEKKKKVKNNVATKLSGSELPTGGMQKNKAKDNEVNPVTICKLNGERNEDDNMKKKKKKKKKKEKKAYASGTVKARSGKVSKCLKKRKSSPELKISDARLKAYGLNPKKFKNKLKYGNKSKLNAQNN